MASREPESYRRYKNSYSRTSRGRVTASPTMADYQPAAATALEPTSAAYASVLLSLWLTAHQGCLLRASLLL
eukprot:4324589-Prymnesium_polylepis.1